MRRLAAGDDPVNMVADQVGTPTYSVDLVAALLELVERPDAPPLLHLSNEGAGSRFDQARAVFEGVGADPDRVRPVATEDMPRPAARPPYSALSSRAAIAAGLTPLRPWRDALAAALIN
jgi:dTDP-4-dehydrorhamnose reductase